LIRENDQAHFLYANKESIYNNHGKIHGHIDAVNLRNDSSALNRIFYASTSSSELMAARWTRKLIWTDARGSAIVIKATTKWGGRRRILLSCDQRKVLFEQCPESTIKDNNSRRGDSLLCLFDGCHVMGIENEDVENGMANGTTCIFKKAYLKHGAPLQPIELNGNWVNSVSVEDVEFLELEWQDSSRFIDRFRIEAKTWTSEVDFPMEEDGLKFKCKTKICLHQFPIVLNHATTGHKLQG
jgi:hypothetical protein